MKKRGFSILEVLIALVVFSIGVGTLMTTTGYNLRDISAAQNHARAIRIAEREMTALRQLDDLPDEETTGQEDAFHWTATAEEVDLSTFPEMDSNQSKIPTQITVEVRWGSNHKVRLHGFEIFKQ